MIPLNTPAGAEIICIDDTPIGQAPALARGAVYTFAGWTTEEFTGRALCDLVELPCFDWAYPPDKFRLLDTGLLEALLREAGASTLTEAPAG
jgi:hypothetical protein